MTTLYCRDNNGGIREWSIERDEFDIVIRHGVMGGSMQEKREAVTEGKASRDIDEQIMSRMASRVHKQLDKGYVNSLDKVGEKAVNSLGLHKPMLAQKFRDVKNIDYSNAFVQYKYDGNRCLVTMVNGEVIAYSRNGKRISTIGHILADIDIEEGETLDGELYCHGYPLQTLVSWIKRKQEKTLLLKYMIYDVISEEPFSVRLARLQTLSKGSSWEGVPTYRIEGEQAVRDFLGRARASNYEGAIVRWGDFGYEDGKRSKSLVKVKAWEDDEFEVVDIIPSKDGWARLVCDSRRNTEFKAAAPGSMLEKYRIMENKDDYIGKQVRVEFAFWTKEDKPFHPVATMWREKNEE